jgi:hypothetical protein
VAESLILGNQTIPQQTQIRGAISAFLEGTLKLAEDLDDPTACLIERARRGSRRAIQQHRRTSASALANEAGH